MLTLLRGFAIASIEKSLGGLAERINAEHRACETAVNSALRHAMNAGEMLSEAKASLPHGYFGPWLRANFAGSDRTARAYMRVHSRRDELDAKRQRSANLSLDGALRALSTPKLLGTDGKDTREVERELENKFRKAGLRPKVATGMAKRMTSPGGQETTGGHLSSAEQQLLETFRSGKDIVVNMHKEGPHANLFALLNGTDQFKRADRNVHSRWANPFEENVDGDRETVVRLFEQNYFPFKLGLQAELSAMEGPTAWGCWCAPELCHCDVLVAFKQGISLF